MRQFSTRALWLARKRRLYILLYFSTFLAYRTRKCNAGAAPSSGSGALLEQLAVRSEGRGSFAVDLGGYAGLPKAVRGPHSVVISKAGPSRAIFSNAARLRYFSSRSLASSERIFSFFCVNFDCVKRTGRHRQPAQADFEPSAMEFGTMVRHACRRDTNVIRSR